LEQLLEMGYQIAGTPGTAEYFARVGHHLTCLLKPDDTPSNGVNGCENVLDWISNRCIDLVINIPEGSTKRDEVTAGYLIRRAAVDFGIGLLTNIK
jgi:hypothetical protein